MKWHTIIPIIIFSLFSSMTLFANDNVVNVYSWSDYIPQKVIRLFEKQTGIQVNLSEYDSNETMYAKLKANPDSGYDIVIPSDYFVDRMRHEKMLHKIDTSKIPNIHYLNSKLLHLAFDPNNEYSIPYLWGTVGIVVNRRYWDPKTIQSWSQLWQTRFKNQLLMLNDPRQLFGMALLTLGYSINDTNPKHIEMAYQKLQQLMQNIKVFNSDAAINIYTDEDATIGMDYSGDVQLAMQGNPSLVYIYPQDGFSLWVDNFAMPKTAQHVENAYKFINFILRPEITKYIMLNQGFASANQTAIRLLPKKFQDNPLINPDKSVLTRGHFLIDIGKANETYQKYWQLLKLNIG